MSIRFISAKQTTQKVCGSVTYWENPAVNVVISSKGEVFNKLSGKLCKKGVNGYGIKICNEHKLFRTSASFQSLYAAMVLGKPLGGLTIVVKDSSKGWEKDNVKVVAKHVLMREKRKANRIKSNVAIFVDDNKMHDTPETEAKKLYTCIDAVDSYRTEDGAIFPTKELAEWHQDKVSKGKGNAQVVLDFNSGYALAEAVFHQEVIYKAGKPYKNFCDVMDCNTGVQKLKGSKKFKFMRGSLFSDKSLDFLLSKEFESEEEIIKLNKIVNEHIRLQVEAKEKLDYLKKMFE